MTQTSVPPPTQFLIHCGRAQKESHGKLISHRARAGGAPFKALCIQSGPSAQLVEVGRGLQSGCSTVGLAYCQTTEQLDGRVPQMFEADHDCNQPMKVFQQGTTETLTWLSLQHYTSGHKMKMSCVREIMTPEQVFQRQRAVREWSSLSL